MSPGPGQRRAGRGRQAGVRPAGSGGVGCGLRAAGCVEPGGPRARVIPGSHAASPPCSSLAPHREPRPLLLSDILSQPVGGEVGGEPCRWWRGLAEGLRVSVGQQPRRPVSESKEPPSCCP